MINAKRFQDDFCAIAQFGVLDNGGVTRLALTPPDYEARNYLIRSMQNAGLSVRIDSFGNIRGRRAAENQQLPAVMIGSHLDTVPQGGHYDGVIGVLAGLEIIRHLNDENISTKHPVELINFCCEESSRFGVATLGSKGLTGQLTCNMMQSIRDHQGISFYQALQQGGCAPDNHAQDILRPQDIKSFFELHIEQGPVLEHQKIDLGIVTAIAAPTRFRVKIIGQNDHSGTTPMALRHDALVAAAELILAVRNIACDSSPDSVATVGEIHNRPNAMNVIPGEVQLSVDIRDIDLERKRIMTDNFKAQIAIIQQTHQCQIESMLLCDDQPITLNTGLRDHLKDIARQHSWSYHCMPSGAGHDAMHLAKLAPTALVFIPSRNGISHNIAESSSLENIVRGIELLSEAVKQVAQAV
ncbi:MAG: Zn-dependent hydrolase [Desulfuromonas sp.]|nr:MAG: Zn-dependent hydrolase [Desulfuromonas sp.]